MTLSKILLSVAATAALAPGSIGQCAVDQDGAASTAGPAANTPTVDASTALALPRLNEPAPDFDAPTTDGRRKLADYNGKWLILFSHPADFTPVCTTEFIAFAKAHERFRARNTELLGLSIDSRYSHIAWMRTIEEKFGVKIPFPIIDDLSMNVAHAYGMVHPGASDTAAVRTTFVIDPNGVMRAMLYYPMTNGRSVQEIERLVDALQKSDRDRVATPEGWTPGGPVIVPPPATLAEADARMSTGETCVDWFFCTRDDGAAVAEEPHGAFFSDALEPYECGTVARLHTQGGIFLASQPQPDDFAQAKMGGVKTVIDMRHAAEVKEFDERTVVTGLGLAYLNPAWNGPDELTDAILDRTREMLRTAERPLLIHCSSANRVGAVWYAWRALDDGVTIEQALSDAKTVGLKSPDYERIVRAYIERNRGDRTRAGASGR